MFQKGESKESLKVNDVKDILSIDVIDSAPIERDITMAVFEELDIDLIEAQAAERELPEILIFRHPADLEQTSVFLPFMQPQ